MPVIKKKPEQNSESKSPLGMKKSLKEILGTDFKEK
jgi:hypothetical protein